MMTLRTLIESIVTESNDMDYFTKIAQSKNPYIKTEYGKTKVFINKLKKDNGRPSLWIEYPNENGNTTQTRVSPPYLKSVTIKEK